MVDNIDEIISRIQQIYSSCTKEEQYYLYQILQEFADYGESKTYENIWLSDYIEIPVTIDTFLESPMFLGKVTRNGTGVYPYWRKVLREIFSAGNRYDECIFTGSTRIGKTSTAITGAAYVTYRLMCLRNPQQFFNIKEESKISILFFNITKDLAKGVAFREYNDTLKSSPWFCLTGNTEVLTSEGFMRIDALSKITDFDIQIATYDPSGNLIYDTPQTVIKTADVETIRYVILSDGSIITGTPNHLILQYCGKYTQLADLNLGNTLLCIDSIDDLNNSVHTKAVEVTELGYITASSDVPVFDIVNLPKQHNFIIRGNSGLYVSHNCSHGTFSRSQRDPVYIPEGNKFIIDYGSEGSHALGQQVFCVVGDTRILTNHGIFKISELSGQYHVIYQYDYNLQGICPCRCLVNRTSWTNDTIRVALTDGTTIEGTARHLVMLADGRYKPLVNLSTDDIILSILPYNKRINIGIKAVSPVHYSDAIPVYDIFDAKPHHNFLIVGATAYQVLHNCAIMDEANFARSGIVDVNKAKERMLNTYHTISARIKGTFRKNGEVYGKMFAVSSKKSDNDFIESHIETQQRSGAGYHMYIVDKPQWEVLPPERFHKETFYIAVGDKNKRGFVVPEEQCMPDALDELTKQGYTLLTPPIDMKPEFVADFDIALRDLAGISVPGTLSFITQESINRVVNENRRNPFINAILQTGMKDSYTIEEFFHKEFVDYNFKRCPLYIHLDLALTTDRAGISGVALTGKKNVQTADGVHADLPYYTHAFSIAIEAPRGDKISYAKIVQFLNWLRSEGFNIKIISRDQFQSEYMAQILESQGFKVDKISLDRTPDGYIALRSVILEERIDMLRCDLLETELINLQRDSVTGKVDHPVGGSKDIADSLAGALWDAINDSTDFKSEQNMRKMVRAFTQNNNVNSRFNPNSHLSSVFGTPIVYNSRKR